MDIESEVAIFVEERSRDPMTWGETDCTAWAAAWISHVVGEKFMIPSYTNEEEAHNLIDHAGTLSDLWSDVMDDSSNDEIGMREGIGEPNAGDVGVINTHICGQVGGIFLTHRNFAWRGEQAGFRIIRPRLNTIVKFWRLPCDR